jgi:WD40 repeat protein
LAFGRNPVRGGHPWRLAVGDAGSLITIWNLDKNLPSAFCRESKHEVHSLAFSPDGVLLASAGRDKAKLWDVATGSLLLDLANRNTMQAVSFSPDGKHLAVSSIPMWEKKAEPDRGGVDIWELQNSRGIQTLRGLSGNIASVYFSRDDRLIAALSHDWQLGVWDVVSGRLQYIMEVPKGRWIDNFALAFNKNTSQLACCTGRAARLYDLSTGEQLREWSLPAGLNDHLAFHPSGKLLLFRNENAEQEIQPAWSNSKYNVCRIRDLFGQEFAKPIAEIRDFSSGIKGGNISPDGNQYYVNGLTTGLDGPMGMIKAFNGITGKELWSLPFDHNTSDGRTTVDPNGGRFVSCYTKLHTNMLVEAASGKIIEIREDEKTNQSEFPGQKYWRGVSTHYLYRDKSLSPLVKFDLEIKRDDLGWVFNSSQTQFAWGNEDGTVMVVDISDVQRRLAEIGLGW